MTYKWEWSVGQQGQKAKGDIQMGVVSRTTGTEGRVFNEAVVCTHLLTNADFS